MLQDKVWEQWHLFARVNFLHIVMICNTDAVVIKKKHKTKKFEHIYSLDNEDRPKQKDCRWRRSACGAKCAIIYTDGVMIYINNNNIDYHDFCEPL